MAYLVRQALKAYITEHCKLKTAAPRRQEYAAENLDYWFGDQLLPSIDIPACREYAAARREKGISNGTIRRELGVLQAAANHAVAWRRINPDQAPMIELPAGAPPKTVWLYRDELKELYAAADAFYDRRAARFIRIAYYTAARRASIEGLTKHQIDLEASRINLGQPGERVTNKRRPIVPLFPQIRADIEEMMAEQHLAWLFGEHRLLLKPFERAAEAAGLVDLPRRGMRAAGKLTPHVLRHSRATHLLQEGKSIFAVASLLGDSVTTVQRVYGHACADHMAELL